MNSNIEILSGTAGLLLFAGFIGVFVSTLVQRLTVSDATMRLEAKVDLILKEMNIAFPPAPSAHVQDIARSKRIAAIKAYREETGVGLKLAKDVIDQWRTSL